MLKYRLISFPLLIALGALIFCWKEGGVYIYICFAMALRAWGACLQG